MNPDCISHLLTDGEREEFNRLGYLIVRGAIPEDELEHVCEVIDRIDNEERSESHGNRLLSVPDIIPRDSAFLELIDCPRIFPKVWGILGWNIYLYHSHMDVTPPGNQELQPVAWHQDSMRLSEEIETHPRPRLSLKVGYFLSDASEPDRGNTLILPGSHLVDGFDYPADGISNPEGCEPLLIGAGDAVILDRRAWHSRSPNHSEMTSKVLWYGYGYRWLRPKDELSVEHLLADLDPVRRQILGAGNANSAYDPNDEEVPLRVWLREHAPNDAQWTQHPRPQARPPAYGSRSQNSGRL